MAATETFRSMASARVLLAFADEHGMSAALCLRGTGVEPRQLVGDDDAELPSWQELQIIRNVIDSLPADAELGLRLGRRYHLSSCGIAGLGLISAPDARTALEFVAAYRRHFHGFCRTLPEPSGVRIDHSRVPADLRRVLVERDLALIMNGVEDAGAPDNLVTRVELTRPAPADPAVFSAALGCDVRYSCDSDRLVFDPQAMRRPLRQADPTIHRWCVRACEQQLARSRARRGLAGQVRELLRARPATMPDLPQMAAEMLTTPRTLRRRLAAAGTTYREATAEVRVSLAKEWLESSAMTVGAIGERLGYSETAAFTRAFKGRTGVSPHAYRKRAQRMST
ncbi:AraC family transcriptional regulator ligand-binding domain-containing protein [Nocardioides sp. NPDC000445]|uniref:AraC family transcriptional regulator n=1 Tax=Nocardioides sp. NPDC000445 TaxID=3154257 RepID=UPI00331685E0